MPEANWLGPSLPRLAAGCLARPDMPGCSCGEASLGTRPRRCLPSRPAAVAKIRPAPPQGARPATVAKIRPPAAQPAPTSDAEHAAARSLGSQCPSVSRPLRVGAGSKRSAPLARATWRGPSCGGSLSSAPPARAKWLGPSSPILAAGWLTRPSMQGRSCGAAGLGTQPRRCLPQGARPAAVAKIRPPAAEPAPTSAPAEAPRPSEHRGQWSRASARVPPRAAAASAAPARRSG